MGMGDHWHQQNHSTWYIELHTVFLVIYLFLFALLSQPVALRVGPGPMRAQHSSFRTTSAFWGLNDVPLKTEIVGRVSAQLFRLVSVASVSSFRHSTNFEELSQKLISRLCKVGIRVLSVSRSRLKQCNFSLTVNDIFNVKEYRDLENGSGVIDNGAAG